MQSYFALTISTIYSISHDVGGWVKGTIAPCLSQKPDALKQWFPCMRVGYCKMFSKIRFWKWWRHHLALIRHHIQSFAILFQFLTFSAVFCTKLLIKHSHHHHNAITWRCEVIGKKRFRWFSFDFLHSLPFHGKCDENLFAANFK